ncbi:MAG: hypothetical protein ACOCRX_10205, partial [Candidatus Woesearchaeota archaeon]
MKKVSFILAILSCMVITVTGMAEVEVLVTENNEIEDHDISSFGQAPEFEEMVADGELPPVEERLPQEPF